MVTVITAYMGILGYRPTMQRELQARVVYIEYVLKKVKTLVSTVFPWYKHAYFVTILPTQANCLEHRPNREVFLLPSKQSKRIPNMLQCVPWGLIKLTV